MEKKRILAVFLVTAAIVFLALAIILNLPHVSKSPETCNTLKYNSESGINFVFLSDKKTAEKYSEFLISLNPFKENEDNLNFYYIDSSPECEIYQNIALLCYSKEIIKTAARCPNDIIIIPQARSSGIRSSSFMNFLSINTNLPITVLAHETGHALANLADEYSPAQLPSKSTNCVSSCEKFDKKDGCFQGCSKDSYYRSIDKGIMKTLSSKTFGVFDSSVISQTIAKRSASITGKAISEERNCEDENYYLIIGNYSSGKVEILEKSLEKGCVGSNGNGNFQFKLIMDDNSEYSENFNPELIFTDSQSEGDEGITGEVFNNEGEFALKLPAVENAKTLEIYDSEDKRILEINPDINSRPCKIE